MTRKSEATKAKILDCAVRLFNGEGTHGVNTHDIAKAADLSPGNLYYHFKNKEEIILEIFARMEIFSVEEWSRAIASGFPEFMRFFFSHLRKYRFFFREQPELVRAIPSLGAKWKKAQRDLSAVMHDAVDAWVDAGIMKRFDSPEDIDHFIDNSWILMTFGTEKSVAAFLRPYHSIKGQRLLDAFFDGNR